MKLQCILLGSILCVVLASPAGATDWTVLFDGKPTDKLRGYKQTGFPTNSWVITDGALKSIPGHGVDLVTVDMFENFELEFEWKVSPGGNSGVMYHVAEIANAPYETGPEYQLLDDDKHPDGRNPKTSAGSLYALIQPSGDKKLQPVGQYNQSRIVFKSGHVEHWLNGAKVVEYEWGSPEVKQLVVKSKFRNMPGFMTQKTGHIDFQAHGQEVWLRNIRVRVL